MKRSVDYILGYERDLMDKDRERNTLFNAMWNMAFLKWDFTEKQKRQMQNVRTLIDASPADAVRNASIALSNTIPRWQAAPYGSSLMEYKRVERLEHCIDWQFRKMNQRGVGTLLYDKMFSSILYDMIVTRVDDLEFQLKGVKKLSPLQKRIRSQGRFLGQVFDPRTIHVEFGMGTLTALLHVENLRAWDVYNYWKMYENNETKEGKQVSEALRKMEENFAGKKEKDVRDMRFTFFEFINDDQILKHGRFIGNGTQTNIVNSLEFSKNPSSDIVFTDTENDLGFINWSVRIGGTRMENNSAYQVNPMLAPLHWGNSWETLNVVRSLVMSEPIKRMFEAHQIQTTMDGQRLPESEDGVIVGNRGDNVQNLPPAPLDPNAINIVQALQQELTRTTGANVLSDVASARSTPFATLNAMIQVAMSRLDINRRDGALSCQDDANIMLRWVDTTKVPLMSYRWQKKSNFQQGEQVTITANDFDADNCELMVDIKPKTPTDYQQQILSAIQLHDKLQVPYAHVQETLGLENVDLLKNQWEDEQFNQAELQAAIQNIMTQEARKAQEAEAMANQPQPGGISQGAMGATNGLGQGMNPAMGGTSPSTMMPGMTREMVSGQTQGGAPVMAGG